MWEVTCCSCACRSPSPLQNCPGCEVSLRVSKLCRDAERFSRRKVRVRGHSSSQHTKPDRLYVFSRPACRSPNRERERARPALRASRSPGVTGRYLAALDPPPPARPPPRRPPKGTGPCPRRRGDVTCAQARVQKCERPIARLLTPD
jgi:hypothetical protein